MGLEGMFDSSALGSRPISCLLQGAATPICILDTRLMRGCIVLLGLVVASAGALGGAPGQVSTDPHCLVVYVIFTRSGQEDNGRSLRRPVWLQALQVTLARAMASVSVENLSAAAGDQPTARGLSTHGGRSPNP